MEPIPGAYPVDLATPTPGVEEPQPHVDQYQQPHQHNKLHKPEDPRGHKYTDSGIGMADSQPIQPPAAHEPKFTGPSEAVGGGIYSRDAPQPSGAFEPGQPAAAPTQDRDDGHAYRNVSSNEPTREEVGDNQASDPKAQRDGTTPPYWGNLPKAARGGIYNTVTGHGSPADDHAQHHHLPQRSASDKSRVAGATTDYPSGGLYNTVAGHGSQDEESKRHGLSDPDATRSGARPDTEALLAGSLPKIAEDKEREKPSDFAATETGRSDVSRGFLPETAARDDALLAGSLADKSNNDPASAATGPSTAASAQPQPRSTSPRAFPLSTATHQQGGREESHTEARYEDTPESDSHARDRVLLAAAGAGAGAAASKAADKPNKIRKQKEPSPTDKSRRRSKDEAGDRHDKAIGGVLPHRHKEEKETPHEKKKNREEGSPKGEKKHHKIFGIFHRHKDDKEKDETAATEPTKDRTAQHHDRKKEEAAAAAAAGAGAYGLSHHHKDDKQPKEQRSSPEPWNSQADSYGNRGRVSADDATAGKFDNGSAPAPPARSPKRRSITPPTSTVFAAETPTHPPATSEVGHNFDERAADRPSNDAVLASGAGLAANFGGSQPARRHEQSPRTGAEISGPMPSQTTGGDLYAFENPREPPGAPAAPGKSKNRTPSPKSPVRAVAASEPGNYNTLASGTASGVKETTPTRDADAQPKTVKNEPGNYDVLASGTPSGAHTDNPAVSGTAPTGRKSKDDGESGRYNLLASGTPSGVRIGSKESRSIETTDPAGHDFAKSGEGQYNTLASGTSSGIDASQGPQQPDSEIESARHTLIAAPTNPEAGGLSRETQHEFPSPQQAKEMSPEVLPDAYTASAPRPSKHKSTAYPSPEQAKGMSPEVLPESYTASAPRPAPPPKADDSAPPVPSKDSAVNPALAAATGAWASRAGTGSGIGNGVPGKVVHKCQHCGGDNDISSYFSKENMSKMNNKSGGAANPFQEAWTSV